MAHACRALARALVLILAATAGAAAQYYPLRWYTSADGLAHNTVRSLVQDSSGYLWAATLNGVSRFDGVRFRTVDNPVPMLRDRSVRCIVLDSTRRGVWCTTEDGGVFHIDRFGRVARLHAFRDGALEPVAGAQYALTDSRGALWLTAGDAVRRLDPSGAWRRIPAGGRCWRVAEHRALGEVWTIVDQSRILRIRRDGSVAGSIDLAAAAPRCPRQPTLFTLAENPAAGGVWIVAREGLFAAGADPARIRFFPYPRIEGFVYFTPCADAAGNLWCVMTEPGAVSYEYRKIAWSDGSVLQAIGNNQDFSRMLPFGAALEDREGTLWIGADGLAHFRGAGVLNYGFAWDGIPCVPRNMIALPGGDLLIATWGGVYRLRGSPLARHEFLTAREGAPGVATSRVFADPGGTAHWFQFRLGSFRCRAGRTERERRVERDRRDNAFTMRGTLLPAVENGAVLSDGSFATIAMAKANALILVDPRGRRSELPLPADGRGEDVDNACFCASRRGPPDSARLALASEYRLFLVTRRRFVRTVAFADDAPAGFNPALCEDSSGTFWTGFEKPLTGAALYRCEDGRMRAFSAAQLGLPGSAVYTLCAHPNRRELLVGTSFGLYAVDLATLLARRRLTIDDGLASDLVLGVFAERASTIWLLTQGGVSRWEDRGGGAPPLRAPVITGVGTDRGEIGLPAAAPPALFDARPEHIVFRYSVLSYRRRPLFSTRLAGYRDVWSPPTEATDIRYTNLDPGDYAFQVCTVDPDDLRRSGVASIAFTIPTPWYATWWFIALACAALAALLFLGYRVRLAAALRVEQMRARIAFDIHDEIGSTLTGISFLSAMAEKEARGVLPSAEQKLRRIGETTRSLIGLVSDIIWSLKPEQDTFGTFRRRLGDLASELAEGSGIAIRVDVPDELDRQAMPMLVRRNLYFVAREALHNAVKHASCARIDVVLERAGRQLVLTVDDDGRGIAPHAGGEATRGGTGMTSMRRRTAEIGGALAIGARPEGGTRVRVTVRA